MVGPGRRPGLLTRDSDPGLINMTTHLIPAKTTYSPLFPDNTGYLKTFFVVPVKRARHFADFKIAAVDMGCRETFPVFLTSQE